VQLAEAMGFRPIVVDTGDERKKLALSLGAEHFVDFKSDNHVDEVIKLCEGVGAHGVFVTAPQSYGNSLAYLGSRVGSVVMCIALPAAGTNMVCLPPPFALFLLTTR
jgi:propanol-preferring alcohol dehydrogenase